ncbi:DUF6925 family protein [Aquabacter cavernae]|uniref:DUF6925 family protein n=1 Tax=Aquabacter cavernae TaxID=2496029 RepID=UPI000F8D59C6|nr:hypothetical protein [Aquabacter cavernae]
MTDTPFMRLRLAALDPRTGWSLGVFGGIAEFVRAPDEPVDIAEGEGRLDVVTERGGLRIAAHPDAVLIDYEMPSRHEARRVRALACCLPQIQAARAGRAVITELGPDGDALREAERGHVLFDLGIGLGAVEACVRTGVPDLIAALRAVEGQDMFAAPGLMGAVIAHQPHRVFMSALGRIEVYQPIPPPDGRSPDGPHTHVLPKLLAHRRTHAASIPIPEGLVPCLSIHPPHDGGMGRA